MSTFIITALVLIISLTVSWALTCGIIYAITLCFGWPFTLITATGIWLIMLLVSAAVKSSRKLGSEMNIEFKKTGGPYGDECSTYDVIFPKGIEVYEFINYIVKNYSVKKNEWGFFIVNGKRLLEYNRGSAFYKEPWTNRAECEPILVTMGGKKISKIEASGGWSRMDYDLYLEEQDDQT